MELFSPEFFWLHFVYIFILGLCFGSFFNVCIYRIPMEMSIVKPRSHCFKCGYQLKWYDNLPLFSYILLGGKCRSCKTPYSMRYFLIELLTGILYAIVFYVVRYNWALWAYLVLTSVLIIITFTDIDHWIIPDEVSFFGMGAGLFFALLAPFLGNDFIISGVNFNPDFYLTPFINALIGGAAGFGVFYGIGVIGKVLFKKDAMGFGDVKLMVLVGFFLGWINVILVLVLASFLGSIIGGGAMLISRMRGKTAESEKDIEPEEEKPVEKKSDNASDDKEDDEDDWEPEPGHIPFGPFLALAAYIVMLWGNDIISWYLDLLKPDDLYY